MSRVQTSVESKDDNLQGWPADIFPSLLRLETHRENRGDFYLGKADIDRATGGIIHIEAEGKIDKRTGIPSHYELTYRSLETDENIQATKVFELDTRTINTPEGKQVIPSKVKFLGDVIYDEVEDKGAVNIVWLNNVFQSIHDINALMRPPYSRENKDHSPKRILQILLKNRMDEISAKGLDEFFTMVKPSGEFNFHYKDIFNRAAKDQPKDPTFPSLSFARAVIGDTGINTLDPEDSISLLPKSATHTLSGQLFTAMNKMSITAQRVKQKISLLESGPRMVGQEGGDVPSLLEYEFRQGASNDNKDLTGVHKIHTLNLFGKNQKDRSPLDIRRQLLLANSINRDLANDRYPRVMRHLIESELTQEANQIPPPPKGESRSDIIRLQGNSYEKTVAGMGDMLGDCTIFMHTRTDKKGDVHKQGFVLDFGASFPPKGSEYSLGVVDVNDFLGDFDDLLITHKHADHMGSVPTYVAEEKFASEDYYKRIKGGEGRGKIAHGASKDLSRLKKQLIRDQIDKELWPAFEPLEGRGFIHIRDKVTGELCYSIEYLSEGTPHTARTTGYKIYARSGNKLHFCILKLGDGRWGYQNLETHETKFSRGTPEELIDFLSSGNTSIIAEEQRLIKEKQEERDALIRQRDKDNLSRAERKGLTQKIEELHKEIKQLDAEAISPEEIEGRGLIFEPDVTNFKQPGYAPTPQEVEDNLVKQKNLYPDRAMLCSMISTSDALLETLLNTAVRTNSHFSVGGANLVDAAGITNAEGVNKDLDPSSRLGKYIQGHMDDRYAEFYDLEDFYNQMTATNTPEGLVYKTNREIIDELTNEFFSLQKEGRTRGRGDDEYYEEGRLEFIENTAISNSPEFMRALCFNILQSYKQSNRRYEYQTEFEQILKEQFDQDIKLGSIYVGYEAETFRKMVKDDVSRVMFAMTGTQGTENEAEAWTPKLVDGRSTFDSNQKNRKNACLIKKDQYQVVRCQTIIPGNESDAHEFWQKAVNTLGVPITLAVGKGYKHYNIDTEDRRKIIEAELKAEGIKPEYDTDGALIVMNRPIHASGHGYYEDLMEFIKAIQSKYPYGIELITPSHCDDQETIKEFLEWAREAGIQTNGEMVKNHTYHTYEMGKAYGDIKIKIIGKTNPSIIGVIDEREWLKQYGGYRSSKRIIAMTGEAGTFGNALLAGEDLSKPEKSVIAQHWGAHNQEQEDAVSADREYYQRRSPADITPPQEDKHYRGMSASNDEGLDITPDELEAYIAVQQEQFSPEAA